MSTVYLLVGVQGSGKSTWARANAERLKAVILASDEVRNELEARGIDASTEGDQVFAIVEERLGQLVDEGKNVIVDATHARRKWREKHLGIARKHGAKVVAVWLDVPLAISLTRNAQKPGGLRWGERVVPKEILLGVAQSFEPPTKEEFDEVWRLGSDHSEII
jgi:predicted kinase